MVIKKQPVALVAGAGSRLGSVLVPMLSQRGYKVVAASRIEIDFELQENCAWMAFDIRQAEDCRRIIHEVSQAYNGIDLMIICSGYYPKVANFSEQNIDDLLLDIDITYRGPVILSKYFLDANKEFGTGDIIHISSCAAHLHVLTSDRIVYCANKAAISRFSENLNEALKPFGMRSFTVIPWDLSEATDIETLKREDALSYEALATVVLDMVSYKGNAQACTIEVKANFND